MTSIVDNRIELSTPSYNNRLCKVRANKYYTSVSELVRLTHLALIDKDKEVCKEIMEDYVVKFKKIADRSLFLTEEEFYLLYKADTNVLNKADTNILNKADTNILNKLIPSREPLEITNCSIFIQSVIFLVSIYVILIAVFILN